MMRKAILFLIICALLSAIGCSKQNSVNPLDPQAIDASPTETTDKSNLSQEELLSQYVFYTGLATVWEDQSWASKYQDGTHGEGDAILTSEDFLVYDAKTQKLYILARTLTYTSKHTVTVNDLNGKYIRTAYVNATGDLNEYYGKGVAVENTLDFTTLPVRIDVAEQLVITRPPTYSNSWVAYTSTADTVRLGVDRVFPPDSANTPDLSTLPNLIEIKDEKTYGNRESRVYEATTRLWNLTGSFDYIYRQMTFEAFYDAVKTVQENIEAQNDFSFLAESLPQPWPEAAKIGDHLENIASASAQLNTTVDALDAAMASNAITSDRAVDITHNSDEIKSALKALEQDAAADQSAMRSLEDFVLDTSNDGLNEAFGLFAPLVTAIFDDYQEHIENLKQLFDAIDAGNAKESFTEIKRVNAEMTALRENHLLLLENLRDKIEAATSENPLDHLEQLFRAWPEIVREFGDQKVSVDIEGAVPLPEGYPLDVLPLVTGAKVIIAETIPPDSGATEGYTLTLKSDLEATDIVGFYQSLLENDEAYEKMTMGQMTVLSANRPPYSISVMLNPNTLGGDERFLIILSLVGLEE